MQTGPNWHRFLAKSILRACRFVTLAPVLADTFRYNTQAFIIIVSNKWYKVLNYHLFDLILVRISLYFCWASQRSGCGCCTQTTVGHDISVWSFSSYYMWFGQFTNKRRNEIDFAILLKCKSRNTQNESLWHILIKTMWLLVQILSSRKSSFWHFHCAVAIH